jgi:hypothetical protein
MRNYSLMHIHPRTEVTNSTDNAQCITHELILFSNRAQKYKYTYIVDILHELVVTSL